MKPNNAKKGILGGNRYLGEISGIRTWKYYLFNIKKIIEFCENKPTSLKPNESRVMLVRWKGKNTLAETGKIIGLTPERIRQIEAKAIRKLQSPHRLGDSILLEHD